jgi:metal-responsive CopG/Arc/MetJ family transcriptional regulator
MSDMASDRITIRVPSSLGERLRGRSRMRGQTESDLVRQALETYLGQSNGDRSAYARRGPQSPAKDLSTHPRHMRGFGTSK